MNRIILRNEQLRLRAIEILSRQELEPVVLEMIIREHKSKRSEAQNRIIHKLLGTMADYCGYSIEEMKAEMKQKFLQPINETKLPNGNIMVQYKGTSEMNVSELNSFFEKIEAFSAMEFGITLAPEGYDER